MRNFFKSLVIYLEVGYEDERSLWIELVSSVDDTEEDADVEDVSDDVNEIDVLENPGTVPYWSGRQLSSSNTEDVVQPSSSNDEEM